MIIANITSFLGQEDAEHYYCGYHIIDDKPARNEYHGAVYGQTELKRLIKEESEVVKLNKKDGYVSWYVGKDTIRFNTFDEIHEELIKLFPNEIIVTYLECKLFQKMLYRVDGVNLGVKYFGEVFSDVPKGCYKDLLPPLNEIKIKCRRCNKEYNFKDVVDEFSHMGRVVVDFLDERDIDEPCCNSIEFVWNVIL